MTLDDFIDQVRPMIRDELVRVSGCHVHDVVVERVSVSLPYRSTHRERWVIRVAVDDRAAVLGQFPPFSPEELSGHFENYVYGLLRGFARGNGISLPSVLDFVLDIGPVIADESRQMGTLIELKDAIASGVVDAGSLLVREMQRRGLCSVLVNGRQVSGPSVAMMAVVEDVVGSRPGAAVVDLFAGTGTLGRIAESAGGRVIASVDTLVADLNGHFPTPSQAEEADLSTADIVVADPYYCDVVSALHVLTRRVHHGTIVVVNLGGAEPRSWASHVEAIFRTSVASVLEIRRLHDEIVGVGVR